MRTLTSPSLISQATSNANTFTQATIDTAVLDYMTKSGDASGSDDISRAGYVIHLNGDGTASSLFPADAWETEVNWVTLEFIVNIIDANGGLISYSHEHAFALTLDDGVLGY